MVNRTNEFGEFAVGFMRWLAAVGASFVVFVFLVRFDDIVGFVAQGLHIGASWAPWVLILLLAPCLLILLVVIVIGMAIFRSIAGFVEGMKRCPHGIRKASEHLCAQCSAEKTLREKQFAKESAERELRQKLLADSKLLRSEEIARLSKAWLAKSDSYFSMSPFVFEDAVARLFMELGYEVEQTPYSNDGGKDAILWKDSKKYVVECKRYGRKERTGRRDLQVLLAAMHDAKADGAFFITTGGFARTAIEYARENRIKIYDGDHFPILVNEAFGKNAAIANAKVMCESCGETVTFDVFGRDSLRKYCVNLHEVICNIKLGDLKVATTLETSVCPTHRLPMRLVKERWGEYWKCTDRQCKVRIPIKRRMSAAKRTSEQDYPNEDVIQETEPEEEITCITLAKSKRWCIWAPVFKGDDGPNMSLAVPCGSTALGRKEYQERLYDYVEALVRSDPQKAREAVEYFGEPDLLHPSTMNECAYTVSHCDGMNLLLNEIDWQNDNPPRKLGDDEDLPSLMEILEMIPTGRDYS
jgi:HJR/Mrr/RecB family endonuclease